MAIVATALVSLADSVNRTVYTLPSTTPTASELVLLGVWHQETASPFAGLTIGSELSATFVLVDSIEDPTGDRKLWLYRALDATPATGTLTLTFDATVLACCATLVEFSGIDTGGADGADAIVQSATAQASGTSLTVPLSAFGDAANGTYGVFGRNVTTAMTPGAGFTELHDVADAGSSRIFSEWRNDNDTTVDATNGGSSAWDGIAVEIKVAGGGATNTGIWGAPIV